MLPGKTATPLRTALIYATFGTLWILLSDAALSILVPPTSLSFIVIQSVKGWLFVSISAGMIYFILKRDMKSLEEKQRHISYQAGLIEDVSDALISTDMQFRVVSWNPAAEQMYGWKAQEAVGHRLGDFVKTEYPRGGTDEEAFEYLSKYGYWKAEVSQTRRDGSSFPVLASVTYVKNEYGEKIGLVAVNRDITEHKQVEETLAESEEKYRTLVESAEDTILLTDLEGNHLFANSAYYTSLGYGVGDDPSQDGFSSVHPDDLPMIKARMPELFKRGTLLTEYRVRHRSGRWLYRSARSTLIRGHDGEPKNILAIISDITKRKQTEKALLESEERFSKAFFQSPIGIALIDLTNNTVHDVNDTLLEMTRLTRKQVIGQNALKFDIQIDPEVRATIGRELQEHGVFRNKEVRVRIAGGEMRDMLNSGALINIKGKPHKLALLQDITDRKRAEAQLQLQLRHLNSLRAIDTAINTSFDIHVTLDVVLQQVLSQLSVDATAILLLTPQMQTIEYAASRGFQSNAIQLVKLKLGECYACRVMRERKPIHIPGLMEAGGELAKALKAAGEEFVEYYGIPLIVKGEIKGVLEIYQRTPINSDPEWLNFLEALAGQTAIAIENAQLFDNLQRANAELEQRVVQRTEELNQTNLELEHANRAKDEFLATMSHELRTPLNSILGLSETLLEQRRDPLSEHQQKLLRIIESSGSHLLELINDILDLSKIEAGKFDYYPQIITVDEVCKASLSFVKEQATRKSIKVTYQKETSIIKVYADLRRLKQILVNLLTNAVKFTPENGQIVLQVRADEEQDRIRFSVVDTGIGIAAEDLKKLFQPFVQLDSRLTREYEGTGLGLALVQKLTDLHGGSVTVESEVGQGSHFTINLPMGQIMIAQQEVIEVGDKHSVISQGKPSALPEHQAVVLLAEDNTTNILTIGDYLESHGYQVVVAHDGLEAIKKAEDIHPNIILMDIQMPVLDGLTAIQRIRATPRFVSMPIIALTALAMSGDRERCLEAGANEYMSKPVSLKMLLGTMGQLLNSQ